MPPRPPKTIEGEAPISDTATMSNDAWAAEVRRRSKLDPPEVVHPESVTTQERGDMPGTFKDTIKLTVPDAPADWPIVIGEPYTNMHTELTHIGGVEVQKVGVMVAEGVGIYLRVAE